MEERLTNYTIAEGCELPSKGKIYKSGAVNPNVELRCMTTRDEMKRLSPSNTQFKKVADLIEGCMIEKPKISVYDMALGDYEFLLHKLRIVSYGPNYKMSVRCQYCGELFDGEADLEQLQVREFDYEKFESLRTFTLPSSGDTITIKFQTPRMLDEIDSKTKEMKRRYKDADIDFNLLVLLQQVIDEVNGLKMESTKLETYINRLPVKDTIKIINNLDALNECIGVNSSLDIDCPKCGGEVHTFFRFGPEFFRPTNI